MKAQRILSETGYLLHARPYRETSLLIEVFTEHYGRVSMVARGVRGTSKKPNHLQSFTAYDFSWMGKSELYTMMRAESQKVHLFSPYQLCCGLYINELLLRALGKEDPHPDIYLAYEELLNQLNIQHNIEIALRIFERNLLQSLGYGFSFENIEEDKFYLFQISQGFIEASEKTKECFSGKILLTLSELVGGLPLQNDICRDDRPSTDIKEIKRLMRIALSPLVGEKPLRSRELFI
jgi:DNA repair protein RecO (recombination protein O)